LITILSTGYPQGVENSVGITIMWKKSLEFTMYVWYAIVYKVIFWSPPPLAARRIMP